MTQYIYIALDIDSTVIEHCYPLMDGADIGALPWLKALQRDFPVRYLINTMRSGISLQLAEEWLIQRGLSIAGSGLHPTQHEWTASTKCYAHLYVDDRAVGAPLLPNGAINWVEYGPMLLDVVARIHRRLA